MNENFLKVSHVSKVFTRKEDSPVTVLQGLDFEVSSGERVSIIGKSGAGKSTLLHILGTLDAPTSGTITFEEENVFNYSEEKLSAFRNESLGFVFQFHYLMLEFSALENVMMPSFLSRKKVNNAVVRAKSLLNRVGLSDRLHHKPGQHSGGEQQRVAIARALMMSPKLLLTDEMTGNLDPLTGSQIVDLIRQIHQDEKMALISVTHDEKLAFTYDRVFKLMEGRLEQLK